MTFHCTDNYEGLPWTKMAPPYAIIFMGDLEKKGFKDCDKKPLAWWQYIDDIFVLWQRGEKVLEKFLEFLNCYHPTMKFTAIIYGRR